MISVSTEDCWLYAGNINNKGYGVIGSPSTRAHRATYQTMVGPVPEGLELDHLCRVRACINPDHLEAVTHQENMIRSPIVGRPVMTHCIRGHKLEPNNVYIAVKNKVTGRVGRQCSQCQKDRDAIKRMLAKKAELIKQREDLK